MRRLIVTATVGVVVLFAAGCDNGTATSTASKPPTPSASPSASPSRDPKAQEICDDLHRNILDVDAKAFGTELGKMIAARARGNKTEETQSQQDAVAKLNEIAGKLRTHAGEATDPRLKGALNASAGNLEKLAGDTDNLSKLNSLDQVGQTTQKFAAALSDIADYCSAA
jgi:hypothetical protein